MRLLFLTNVYPSPWLPTKGTFNRALVRQLRAGHQVRAMVPVAWTDRLRRRATGPVEADTSLHRYWFTPRLLRPWYDTFLWASMGRAVAREVRSRRPDAVIGYWAHPDGEVARRAARLAGAPFIQIVGGSDILLLTADLARRERILRVLRSADVLLAVGQDLTGKLVGLGLDPTRIRSFTRGVDREIFHPGDRAAARQALGLPVGRPVLLWAGRMEPVKGLDVLLRAFAQVTSGEPILVLVGDGSQRTTLERQAARLGVGERVRFAGAVPHEGLAAWFRAADLTLLSSHSEGVPNVLPESLACGTPFVSTSVGSVASLTTDPAVLAPPGNPAALAAAVSRALGSPPRLDAYVTPPGQEEAGRAVVTAIEEALTRRGRG